LLAWPLPLIQFGRFELPPEHFHFIHSGVLHRRSVRFSASRGRHVRFRPRVLNPLTDPATSSSLRLSDHPQRQTCRIASPEVPCPYGTHWPRRAMRPCHQPHISASAFGLRPCGFRHGLAGYAPHGPLTAAFRSLPTVALPGRARFLVSTITTRPAAPMGFTLRGFHPIRKALEPFSSAYPAYCSFQRPPWLFLPKVWLSTTDSSAEPMPRHSHPLVPYDSQNGALKTQLPGFVQPNDPRRTMPSFHGAPRCRPGLCNT
jgi:hypothetical protein